MLALKGNQGKACEVVTAFFEGAKTKQFKGVTHDIHETIEADHGRVEGRVWCTLEVQWFADRPLCKDLSFALVEAERHFQGQVSVERRYYLSSLPGEDASQIGEAIRSHWGIEKSQHWVLDVAFREDDHRVRQGHAAENLATLRRIALNLLKQEKTAKVGT